MINLASRRRQQVLALLLILALGIAVRALTANFIRAHLNDASWFPYGIYAVFDRQAQAALDDRGSLFWIGDSSRTDLAVYPPGYPLWLAMIYKLTGSRSAATVQDVQWVLDALSVFLIVGIGVTAFGWQVGLWAGAIAALWPLLAVYGALPLADAPTSWLVLAGVWMLLLAVKRSAIWWAIAAGAFVGFSCWLRANALLLIVFWAVALFVFSTAVWRQRLLLSGCLLIAGLFVIAPIVIRNATTFHAVLPTGLGLGTNLWEGLSESERGRMEFGAPSTDAELIEQERAQSNFPPDKGLTLYYPDGISRDRERARKSLNIIARHPIWYSSLVFRRMLGVLKYAGAPMGDYGSAGVNVTSKKCLPENRQGGALAVFVNVLGITQSVMRFLLIPLIVVGLYFAFRIDKRVSAILATTLLYYWVVNSMMHTHIRYGLPMHALFTVFASVTIVRLFALPPTRHRTP